MEEDGSHQSPELASDDLADTAIGRFVFVVPCDGMLDVQPGAREVVGGHIDTVGSLFDIDDGQLVHHRFVGHLEFECSLVAVEAADAQGGGQNGESDQDHRGPAASPRRHHPRLAGRGWPIRDSFGLYRPGTLLGFDRLFGQPVAVGPGLGHEFLELRLGRSDLVLVVDPDHPQTVFGLNVCRHITGEQPRPESPGSSLIGQASNLSHVQGSFRRGRGRGRGSWV